MPKLWICAKIVKSAHLVNWNQFWTCYYLNVCIYIYMYFLSNAIKIHQNNKCLCVGFLDKTEHSHSNIVWNWFRWVEMRAIFYAGSLGLPLTGASVLLLFSSSFLQFSFIIHKISNLASGALWRQSESMDGMGMGHTP